MNIEQLAESLYEHIKHGDAEHRHWLKEQSQVWAQSYFAGWQDENAQLLKTLTEAQAEGTRLVEENRALKAEYDEEVISHDIEEKDLKEKVARLKEENRELKSRLIDTAEEANFFRRDNERLQTWIGNERHRFALQTQQMKMQIDYYVKTLADVEFWKPQRRFIPEK